MFPRLLVDHPHVVVQLWAAFENLGAELAAEGRVLGVAVAVFLEMFSLGEARVADFAGKGLDAFVLHQVEGERASVSE